MVNAKATRRYEDLLRAINSNRFASGGMVGGKHLDLLPRYASGGSVRSSGRTVAVNLGELLGRDLARGLRAAQRPIDAELGKVSKG